MSQAYIGQVQPFAFNFPPKNWAQCNGQIIAIQQNSALFSLLGTMYGGNGTTTFALPNLQSRVPMHAGTLNGETFTQGETSGTENVLLTSATTPAHTHAFQGANTPATAATPAMGVALATSTGGGGQPEMFYGSDAMPQPLNVASIGVAGGSQPHNNLQPYLTINWCICQFGVYPARN
jgi:microcystin-dependent protein